MSSISCKENGVFFNMNKTAHDIYVGSKNSREPASAMGVGSLLCIVMLSYITHPFGAHLAPHRLRCSPLYPRGCGWCATPEAQER